MDQIINKFWTKLSEIFPRPAKIVSDQWNKVFYVIYYGSNVAALVTYYWYVLPGYFRHGG